MKKQFWRIFLDILLIILLSIVAISQVYESCVKWYQRQTTETVSLRDIDQEVLFKGILQPVFLISSKSSVSTNQMEFSFYMLKL